MISSVHGVYLIGASSRALEATYEHGRAFYDYFQVHDLKGFSDDDTFALLNRLAEEARDERVQKLLRENPARVRALRVLTGGNPRTLVLLYRVLAEGPKATYSAISSSCWICTPRYIRPASRIWRSRPSRSWTRWPSTGIP